MIFKVKNNINNLFRKLLNRNIKKLKAHKIYGILNLLKILLKKNRKWIII